MDDTLLTTIVERFGTPVFAYDLDAVSRQVARHRSALPAAELLYAVKANPNGALLRHLLSVPRTSSSNHRNHPRIQA